MGSHSTESGQRSKESKVIDFRKVLIALNTKADEVAMNMRIDIAFGGRTLGGEIYKPEPDVSYLNCYLMPNDTERRGLKNGESEVMRGAIYQIDVYATKEGKANPDLEALQKANEVRANFAQGLILTADGQDCKVTYCNSPFTRPSDTHKAYTVDVIFECIA